MPDLPVGPVPGVPPEVPAAPPVSVVRRPSTLGGIVYLAVVAATIVGLLIVAFGPWRRGITIVGVAMLVAALVRLALSDFDGGMLRVRSKIFDVAVLSATGALLVVLAAVIPNQAS